MNELNTQYTKEHRCFYMEVPDYDFGSQRISIASPKDPAEDVGIRLYSTQYNQAWSLQIRGFFQNRNYQKGKKWYYANATLTEDSLRALREACDAALADLES